MGAMGMLGYIRNNQYEEIVKIAVNAVDKLVELITVNVYWNSFLVAAI